MKKFFIGIITFLLFLYVGFVILTEVLKVGETLNAKSIYLEYTFYAIAALLFYVLILDPILTVFFAPYYSVSKFCTENATYSSYKKRALRLKKYGNLSQEDIEELNACLKFKGKNKSKKLAHRIAIIYNNRVKKNIDKLIMDTSKDIFYLTAISQNNFIDLLSVLINNIRMMKKIVVLCGFRPSFINSCKLYISIFASSLIADGAQKIDYAALINTSLGGALKLITNSAANGAVNAFFTLRVGIMAKNYLFDENAAMNKSIIRELAITEAATLFPTLLTSLITSPIKSIASLFVSKEKATQSDNEPEDYKQIIEGADFKWKSSKPINISNVQQNNISESSKQVVESVEKNNKALPPPKKK